MMKTCLWRVSAAALVALSSFPAFAAEETEATGSSGGMPQPDPSNFGSQIFWLAVTFGVLYWLMSTKVVPGVEAVINERDGRIQGDLDRAAKLRAEAEELFLQNEKSLAEATSAAQAKVAAAKDAASQAISERSAKLQSELEGKIEAALGDLSKSSAAAMGELETVASEAAVAAVQRLIGVNVTLDEARAVAVSLK